MTEFNEYQFGLELVKLIDDYSDREKQNITKDIWMHYKGLVQPFQVITMKRAMNKMTETGKLQIYYEKIRYFKSIKTLKYNY